MTVLMVNLTESRVIWGTGDEPLACLWGIIWIKLIDVGRPILIVSRTIPWAGDPRLNKVERAS